MKELRRSMKKSVKASYARKAPVTSDEAVKAKTGRTWPEWFSLLGKAGARKMDHRELCTLLYEKHKLSMWWCQNVANEYEQKHGLRERYETCAGDFSSSVSRTFACSVGEIYALCKDPKGRRSWLKGDKFDASSGQPNKTLRGAWDGNTSRLEIRFYSKGAGKTQVVVDHMKMASSKHAIAMKTFWAENLDRLRQRVES
jgi:hypothetical protein